MCINVIAGCCRECVPRPGEARGPGSDDAPPAGDPAREPAVSAAAHRLTTAVCACRLQHLLPDADRRRLPSAVAHSPGAAVGRGQAAAALVICCLLSCRRLFSSPGRSHPQTLLPPVPQNPRSSPYY